MKRHKFYTQKEDPGIVVSSLEGFASTSEGTH